MRKTAAEVIYLDASAFIKPVWAEPETEALAAIHLATALVLQEQVRALVTYDLRLAEAQRLEVVAPG